MPTDYAKILRGALSTPGRASSDFDLNPGIVLPEGRKLTPGSGAGRVPGEWRSSPDQALGPVEASSGASRLSGWQEDPGDADLTATALREAQEEVGLPPRQVEILGTLPCHETVTSFQVTPIVALIHGGFTEIPEAGEVAEVFYAPFTHVADPGNYRIESRRWQGRERRFYVAPLGPYYIWGATARMLQNLAARIAI